MKTKPVTVSEALAYSLAIETGGYIEQCISVLADEVRRLRETAQMQWAEKQAAIGDARRIESGWSKLAVAALRSKIQSAKDKHKASASCEHPNTCGACHFYSGGIHALSELLGESGLINEPTKESR